MLEKLYERHFAYRKLSITDKSESTWQAQFIKKYDEMYEPLINDRAKANLRRLLFSLFKEGDLNSLMGIEFSYDDLDLRDKDGFSPIDFAMEFRHQRLMQYCYEKVSPQYFDESTLLSVQKRVQGRMLLHWAVLRNDLIEILRLIKLGCEVNAQSPQGVPIYIAVVNGDLKTVESILTATDQLNINCFVRGGTSLHLAVRLGFYQIAACLLKHGAGVDIHRKEYCSTALSLAILKRDIQFINLLLTYKADVDLCCSATRYTPLIITLLDEDVDIGIVKLLLAKGANPNKFFAGETSLLFFATQKGNVELVRALLAAGANVVGCEDVLYYAISRGYYRIVELLLDYGVDIKNEFINERDLLLIAAGKGHFKTVKVLLDHGVIVKKSYLKKLRTNSPTSLIEKNVQDKIIELLDRHLEKDTVINHEIDEKNNTDNTVSILKTMFSFFKQKGQSMLVHGGEMITKAFNWSNQP